MNRRITIATIRAALVWVVMVAASAALAYFGSQGVPVNQCLLGLGFVFAGGFLSIRKVAGRPIDIAAIITFLWGATLGLWGPLLYTLSEHFVGDYLTHNGYLPEAWSLEMTQGAAIAAGSFVTAVLLQISTRSANVFLMTMAGTAIAASASLLPWPDALVIPGAAVIWQMLVHGGLSQWAIKRIRCESRGCCPRCGRDIVGISSPVCPSCALPLSNMVPYGAICEIGKHSPRPSGLG